MVALLAALASGLIPALQASSGREASALKDDARTPERRRMRHVFITAQVALSLLLVVVAGLFVRALERAGSIDPGFEPAGVELASIDLSQAGYTDVTGPQFIHGVVDRLRALPGVRAASAALVLPGGFETRRQAVTVPGLTPPKGQQFFSVDWNAVASGYFATLRIPMAAGRDFTDADGTTGEPVAIVGEGTARQFWLRAQAVGQHLQQVMYGPQGLARSLRTLRVIGVARDVKVSSLVDGLGRSFVYVPLQQQYSPSITIVARGTGRLRPSDELRRLIASLDPNLAAATQTMEESLALGQVPQRMAASVAGSLGLVGVLLAAIGIYGVTAYTVTRRTREIGIRIALGALPGDIARPVLRQGLSLMVAGSVIGFTQAAGAGKLLTSFLFGVPPFEPVVFAVAAALLPSRESSRATRRRGARAASSRWSR
jgi:putative ABC transport system permease protein